jgi:hypothetical protein
VKPGRLLGQVCNGGAVAQLGARLDGIEEVVGSNPIGSTNLIPVFYLYILQSETTGRFYIGQTQDVPERLARPVAHPFRGEDFHSITDQLSPSAQ